MPFVREVLGEQRADGVYDFRLEVRSQAGSQTAVVLPWDESCRHNRRAEALKFPEKSGVLPYQYPRVNRRELR